VDEALQMKRFRMGETSSVEEIGIDPGSPAPDGWGGG
jgi:hypothetical protein